jgi:ankyrin repeat protein
VFAGLNSHQIEEHGAYLYIALYFRKIDLLKFLIELGVNIPSKFNEDETYLYFMTRDGNFKMFMILFNAGANLYARDRWGGDLFCTWLQNTRTKF